MYVLGRYYPFVRSDATKLVKILVGQASVASGCGILNHLVDAEL